MPQADCLLRYHFLASKKTSWSILSSPLVWTLCWSRYAIWTIWFSLSLQRPSTVLGLSPESFVFNPLTSLTSQTDRRPWLSSLFPTQDFPATELFATIKIAPILGWTFFSGRLNFPLCSLCSIRGLSHKLGGPLLLIGKDNNPQTLFSCLNRFATSQSRTVAAFTARQRWTPLSRCSFLNVLT